MKRIGRNVIVASLLASLFFGAAPTSVAAELGGSISGHVYQADNITPLAGSVVYAKHVSKPYVANATAASDGSYFISNLPTGDYKVYFKNKVEEYYSGGHYFLSATPVSVIDPYQTTGIDFSLQPEGSISGFVFEGDNTTPIAQATVHVQMMEQQYEVETTTGADGSYSLPGLPEGRYWMYADAHGYVGEYHPSTEKYYNANMIEVAGGAMINGVNFSLSSGGSISGTVIQSDNSTLMQGVLVRAYFMNPPGFLPPPPALFPGGQGLHPLPSPRAITAADGSYSLDGLPSGNYSVMAYSEGYIWYDITVAVIAPYETAGANFTLAGGSALSGYVFQSDNVTPANAQVRARLIGGSEERGTNTSANGSYRISGLPSGDYVVSVWVYSPDFVSQYYGGSDNVDQAIPVTVTAPHVTPGIDFTLRAGAISGRVYRQDSSAPIAGARVFAFYLDWLPPPSGLPQAVPIMTALTAGDGSYTVTSLRSGNYRVSVSAGGYLDEFYQDTRDYQQATTVVVNAPMIENGIDFDLDEAPVSLSGLTPRAKVIIDAPSKVFSGDNFTTFVNVEGLTDLRTATYNISFNVTELRLDSIAPGIVNSTSVPINTANETAPGIYTISQSIAQGTGLSGSGYLAVLQFSSIGTQTANNAINLGGGSLSNAQARAIPTMWVWDSVEIVRRGDANNDGNVNALDITKLERIITGLDHASNGADANGDGSINAIDITALEMIIVGLD